MTGSQRTPQPGQAGGFNLNEVYYVLFRRKWLILLFSLAGLSAAAAIYFRAPRLYQSDAKLLVRYVLETRVTEGPNGSDQVRSPDSRGTTILNAEMQILTSLDLALDVAKRVRPEDILPPDSIRKDEIAAAGYIKRNLVVGVERNSSVMDLSFQHPNSEVARTVLEGIVDEYLKRHVEIHRTPAYVTDYLTKLRDQSASELDKVEKLLADLKNKLGVDSVEDSRRILLDQESQIRRELLSFEAELAERQAILNQFQTAASPQPDTNNVVSKEPVPPDKIEEYRRAVIQLDAFRKREQDLLAQFTPGNSMVKKVHALVVEAETAKRELENDFPGLKQVAVETVVKSEGAVDIAAELARVTALQAKIAVRTKQLDQAESDRRKLESAAPEISELQSRRDLLEAERRGYQTSLNRHMDLPEESTSNIAIVQKPSPAGSATSQLMKLVGGVLAAGVGGGIGLAFLIEMFLRQSVRRSSQLEKQLGLRLFVSIPKLNRRRKDHAKVPTRPAKIMGASSAAPLLKSGREEAADPDAEHQASLVPKDRLEVAQWHSSHDTWPYVEALRDRLMTFFEVRKMNHKPKLVALTSCHAQAGVTTVASGLAASLSETGDGNVLLVSMNANGGGAQPFFKGKPLYGLGDEIFDGEKRIDAQVQDRLFVVAEDSKDRSVVRMLPKRLLELVPRLKASDYDYIIFDMPPVSQTSVTPRVARFMDMTLLVVEAERTNAEHLRKANDMLAESGTNVGAVMNKTRSYLPKSLSQELV